MRRGDVVIAPAGAKDRPCIVLRVFGHEAEELLLVTWGRRSAPPEPTPFVLVEPGSEEGKQLGLDVPRHFSSRNVARIATAKVTATGRTCPETLVIRLRTMIGLRP